MQDESPEVAPSSPESPESALAEEQLVLTLDQTHRDFMTAQISALSAQNGVRARIREERGTASSLYIIDLRGTPQSLGTVMKQVQLLLSQHTLVPKPTKRLSRPVLLGLSFLGGLLGIGLLRLIASAFG